ncbi:homoserine dehydrogenase [Halodesulfurarchaeum sp. HSR-GB]|uniref:homoserine dehydrogenase n=1 Tax=Halodesulfurarchaeum sp. HSR-GB TaxID=3074077 RepID=UPI002859C58B|nr:homoserine dehydrogenase [Halodesulfurarchaeum sp. HSR-GB]MDR5656664.1 homoserine dehydrogenase [Halodesulfurarchaeum sp. HSR-GB]
MKLAVMGAGDVGQSVARLAGEYGHTVTAIADSSSAVWDANGVDVTEALTRKRESGAVGSNDPEGVLGAEYDVLIEATPTTLGDAEPGFGHVTAALEQDRDVVLANKGPVAQRYDDLAAVAADSEGAVRFEATVGGAIPAIATAEGLGPEHVTAARGVLNGTANFILSRMQAEGLAYEHVLAEAQDLGVAETDPSFDVEGTDAALKGVILANVLDGGGHTLADARIEGIKDLPANALDVAADDGMTVRLIAEATADRIRVGPRLVPENSTLAVTGTMNILQFDTQHAGQLNISGRGAGGPETASAVLADVDRLSCDTTSSVRTGSR